jgi:hypothetical protein
MVDEREVLMEMREWSEKGDYGMKMTCKSPHIVACDGNQ